MRISRRTFLRCLLPVASAGLLLPPLAGCGSIMFPERIGQPRIGPLDWKVVALDGLGLLLFFVPGVIAFAVDFYNGTIFLPSYAFVPPNTEFGPTPPIEERQLPPPPQENYLPPPPGAAAWPSPAPSPEAFPPGTGPAGAQPTVQPPYPPPQDPSRGWGRADFETIDVPREQLTREGIEQLVSRRLGRPVALDQEATRVIPLNDLAEFGNRTEELAAGEQQGLPLDRAFRRS